MAGSEQHGPLRVAQCQVVREGRQVLQERAYGDGYVQLPAILVAAFTTRTRAPPRDALATLDAPTS